MELYIFMFLFSFVSANCRNESDLRRIDSIFPEQSCSSAGGICTVAADCPQLAEPGLCPQQQSQSVECCYGISRRETRCQKLGGGCMKTCRPNLLLRQARDCKQGSICCVLV